MDKSTPFSVLMSVYFKERADFLDRALRSIWEEQVCKPDEIVLVLDGPLSRSLNDCVVRWSGLLGPVLNLVQLEKNMGLGYALQFGLLNCRFDIVARMDADDISLPCRFCRQLAVFRDDPLVDVTSSSIIEFETDEGVCDGGRNVLVNHDELRRYARYRNPINHPSVMFRRSVVLKAGGYRKMECFEDYYLWVRMLIAGARFQNVNQPLVKMRTGSGQLLRRSGFGYMIKELRFYSSVKQVGFISLNFMLFICSVRCVTRVVPRSVLSFIYRMIRSVF